MSCCLLSRKDESFLAQLGDVSRFFNETLNAVQRVQAVIQLWFLSWFGFEAPDQAINDDFDSAKKSTAEGLSCHDS